jgi:hypothetical protein
MHFMTSAATRILLISAVFISGLLAGLNVDRAFVAMPAWQQVGPIVWAEFSRHADLGNGLILYPAEAFGSVVLTVAAAIGLHFERNTSRAAAALLYGAVLLAALGLLFTIKAAPIMLGIRNVDDPLDLQGAFEGFRYWGNLRGICQAPAFLAQLATLAALWRAAKSPASVRLTGTDAWA